MNNYNSLSEFLKYDGVINEGWLSDLFKGKNASSSQMSSAKSFFGLFGALKQKLGLVSGEEQQDEISKAIKSITDEKLANAEKRASALKKSKESEFIAKLKAKHAHKENQLKLENDRKIKMHDAHARKLKNEETFWKNNKTLFTKEENEAYDKAMEESYTQLQGLGIDVIDEMRSLQLKMFFNEDGTPRDLESLKKELENPDSPLKKDLARYNEICSSNQKLIIESMNSDEFKQKIGEVQGSTTQKKDAEDALKDAEDLQNTYNNRADAVKKIKDYQTKHDNAVTAKKDAGQAISNIMNCPLYDMPKTAESDGTLKVDEIVLSDNKLDEYVYSLCKDMGSTLKEEDINKIKEELKSYGLSEDDINSTIDSTGADNTTESLKDKLKAKLKESETKEKISGKLKEKVDTANQQIKSANDQLDANPDPSTSEGLKKIKESVSPEDLKSINAYEEIKTNGDNPDIYDDTTEIGKSEKKKLNEDVDKAKKKVSDINVAVEKAREERKSAVARLEHTNTFDATERDKIEDELSGIDAGETKNSNGKVGFWKTDDNGKKVFVERPGIKATKEERKKYNDELEEIILTSPISDKKHEVTSIKKNPDATGDDDKYIMVRDGKEEVISAEDAIFYQVEKQKDIENRELIRGKKQEIADQFNKVISTTDGEFTLNKDAYDKLSDAQKKAIMAMVDDPDKYLAGLDMTETDLNKIKDTLKDVDKSKLKDQMSDYLDSEEYKDGEGENDDEVDGEDGSKTKLKDMDDEIETDEEDEEGNKKKIQNPAKIWKKRKKKNGTGSTKNYYNKDGESLSPQDYKDAVERFKNALNKKKESNTQTSTDQQSLSAYIANLSEHKQVIRKLIDFVNC